VRVSRGEDGVVAVGRRLELISGTAAWRLLPNAGQVEL
jgi:hypothetical protein